MTEPSEEMLDAMTGTPSNADETAESADEREWTRDHGEVLRVGRWLVDRDLVTTCADLLYYFSKPWKWTPERQQMIAFENGDAFECKDCGDIAPIDGDSDQTICGDCLEVRHDHELDMRRER